MTEPLSPLKRHTRGVAYAYFFPPLKFGNQSLRKATAEVNDANPTGWYKSRPIIWTRLPLRKLYGEFGFLASLALKTVDPQPVEPTRCPRRCAWRLQP